MEKAYSKNIADKKINIYVTKIKEQLKAVTASISTAQAFLNSTGIYNSSGKIRHNSEK